ncbi:hypothetical protein [Pseudomonas sp. D2002]|uniref:hypothetical protein n=1 Tax=Pseudomonas sp. D2002 TaxID=2726980 RepID=UPI0015A0519A|nr:hypothetical protein [Pseudomonas sp. D2002]NWA81608.1 hypothetical protein [Pseudomonas sp. D2002]
MKPPKQNYSLVKDQQAVDELTKRNLRTFVCQEYLGPDTDFWTDANIKKAIQSNGAPSVARAFISKSTVHDPWSPAQRELIYLERMLKAI